jgi:hypothetical protein
LSQTDERFIYRHVTVRVIALEHLAHDSRALRVLAVRDETLVEHRVENAALYRFKAVSDVREGATDDNGHGVVEVRLTHL